MNMKNLLYNIILFSTVFSGYNIGDTINEEDLDEKEFDRQFDMPYIDDDSNDKKYQTLYKKCDSLLK